MPIRSVNIFEAKTGLSRLVEAVESGAEAEIVIARNGRPAARLVAVGPASTGARIGVAAGSFEPPKDFDEADPAVARLFGSGVPEPR